MAAALLQKIFKTLGNDSCLSQHLRVYVMICHQPIGNNTINMQRFLLNTIAQKNV